MADPKEKAPDPAPTADPKPQPAAAPPIVVQMQPDDRAARAAASMAEAKDLAMDVAAQPGGVYRVPDPEHAGKFREVNANGDPVGSSLDKSRA